MAEGYLAGLLKGFADFSSEERKRVREQEDAEMARKQAILDDLYEGAVAGRIAPEHYAQILKDQMTLAGAKQPGGRKAKGGVSGFFGASEAPMLSFLDSVLAGQVGGMEPVRAPAGLRTEFNSTIPSLNDAGVAAPSLMPPPPAPPPLGGATFGGSPDVKLRASFGPQGPAQTPFNSPRLTMVAPQAAPPAPREPQVPNAPTGPRPLFTNPLNQRLEATAAQAQLEQQLTTQQHEALLAELEADQTLTPEQKAEVRTKVRYGIAPTTGTTQEGDVIPDAASPTGHSRVIWGVRNGKVIETGRIPAPAPKAEGLPVSREDMIRDAAAAGVTVRPEDYSKVDLGLTGAQLQRIEQWRKSMRGAPAQGPRLDMTPMQIYDRTTRAGNDFERFAKESKTAVQQVNVSRAGYRQLKDQIRQGRAQGPATQALIMSFGKVLDPSSVVRESEYNRSQEMQGLIDKFDSYKQSVLAGGILSERVADEMMATIEAVVKSYQNNVRDLAMRTRAQVKNLGGDLRNALTPSTIDTLDQWDAEESLRDDPPGTELTLSGKAYVKLTDGRVVVKPKGK